MNKWSYIYNRPACVNGILRDSIAFMFIWFVWAVVSSLLLSLSYVEHRAFVKLFCLVLSKASPFASFQLVPTSAAPCLLFLVCPSVMCSDGSSAMCVFLLQLVAYVMYGQSNAIFFPLFVV